ncbi:hypothetical protein K1719_035938 [Acacia pycnantha]|nr:hypothetical protein K1719_035938 [Acacia pycnantha]
MDLEVGDSVSEKPVNSETAKRRKQELDTSVSYQGNSVTVAASSGSGDVSKSSMSSNKANSPDVSYQDENDEMNEEGRRMIMPMTSTTMMILYMKMITPACRISLTVWIYLLG